MSRDVSLCNNKIENLTLLINKQADSIRNCEQSIASLQNENQIISKRLDTLEQPSGNSTNVEEILAESRERETRRSNLIVANLTEGPDDISEAKLILSGIHAGDDLDSARAVSGAFRIGKPVANKPRLLKIVLSSPEFALKALKGKSGLRSHPKYKHLYIRADLTPNQSNRLQALRRELDLRTKNGEQDLTIKYIKNIPQIMQLPTSDSTSAKRTRNAAFSPESNIGGASKVAKPFEGNNLPSVNSR